MGTRGRQIVASLALLLGLLQATAAEPPKWRGTYRPISSVCAGSILTLKESAFSYSDCTNAKMKVVTDTDGEFSFEVSSEAKCLIPGWIISLKPDGAEVDVMGYRSAQDKAAALPAFECTYKRQATRPVKKSK